MKGPRTFLPCLLHPAQPQLGVWVCVCCVWPFAQGKAGAKARSQGLRVWCAHCSWVAFAYSSYGVNRAP